LITAPAALENFVSAAAAAPPVALGAFLAGRAGLNLWTVSASRGWRTCVGVPRLLLDDATGASFHGTYRPALLTPPVLAHIEAQYQRQGPTEFSSPVLLPVWRAVVPPFAGIAGLSAPAP